MEVYKFLHLYHVGILWNYIGTFQNNSINQCVTILWASLTAELQNWVLVLITVQSFCTSIYLCVDDTIDNIHGVVVK